MTTAPASVRSYERSRGLYERGREYTTEGVQHPGRYQLPHPIYMARGDGGLIYDVDDNRYIDFSLGSGPLILGHHHPRIVAAVERQLGDSQLYGTNCELEIELARRIRERVPSAEWIRFVGSGTDAATVAVRLARACTGRELVVMNTGGFHGSVDYFMTGNAEAGGRHGEYPGIDRAISDKTLAVAFNDVAALDSLFGAHGARIAAFIVEPVLRGALPPRPGYLEALRQHCDDSGALLIFDEVVTGFRLGPGGAQSYFGVTPDITAYGKIIGGGFPIGAVAGRREIMRYLSPSTPPADRVYLASTWLGFPISLAAGCASLDVLGEPGAYDHLFDLGDYFRHRFNRLFEEIGLPGQALGVGPIFNVFLTDARIEDWASSQPSYRPEGMQQLKRRLLEVGLNMQGPSYLPGFGKYLCVAHTHELIDEAADLFRQAIEDVDLGSYRL